MQHFRERAVCPVCSCDTQHSVYSARYADAPVRPFLESQYARQGTIDWSLLNDATYDVVLCPRCDLLYQRNVPDDALMEQIYTAMIASAFLEPYERGLTTLDSQDRIHGELAVLLRMTGKPPTEITFLDYGFGFGRWARVARGMGARVYATEIGDEKRHYAATLGVEIIDDAQVDAMQFDIVHTEQVLEHLPEPGRDFRRLARAARCVLKAAVPYRGQAAGILQRSGLPGRSPFARALSGESSGRNDEAIGSIQPLEHLNAYSARTMAWLAADSDLVLVSTVRRADVAVDMTSLSRLARSAVQLGVMAGKMLWRPDRGYYLYRKRATTNAR